MIRRLALASAALGLLAAPVAHAEEQAEMTKGEAKLAKMLEGRVAGKPESCITMVGSRPLTRIDETALVYKSGNTIWVNYTKTPTRKAKADVQLLERLVPVSHKASAGQVPHSGEAGRHQVCPSFFISKWCSS